jgi:hypothetical protein
MPERDATVTLFCPTCNVQVEARVVASETEATATRPAILDEVCDVPHDVVVTTFALCRRCHHPFLLEERYCEIPGEFTAPQGRTILYPAERTFVQEGVPEAVARAYEDAAQAYSVGLYEPCVIMCRKALEGITEELCATERNLALRLRKLREKGEIDGKLAEWADGLRLIGNDAAHDLRMRLTRDDARDSLEFLEALLAYTFTLTRRFNEFKERRTTVRTDVGDKDGSK